jgi:nitrate/TMAO reductase-like tetraheme cytochrome c subunit
MKHPIALRTGMLAALAAAWVAAAVSARADVITFDVSATMLPVMGGGADASCVECHRYHNIDHPAQGIGAAARRSKAEMTVEQFLGGGPGSGR